MKFPYLSDAYGGAYGFRSPSRAPLDGCVNSVSKFLLKLNISSSPIANKYHEGKVKSTLERELKVPEIDVNQAIGINVVRDELGLTARSSCFHAYSCGWSYVKRWFVVPDP